MKIRGITKRLLFMTIAAFFVLMANASAWGQTTIAIQDFEATPATPTLAFTTTGTGGSISTGQNPASGLPANANLFASGERGFQVVNGSTTLTFANQSLAGFTNNFVEFRLAGMSINGTNGIDTTDAATLAISLDGGATFSSEVSISGEAANRRFDFTASGSSTTTYDGNNAPTLVTTPSGATGISTVRLNLPNTATQVQIRITLSNNDANERWVIDDVRIAGTAAPAGGTAPTITSANNTTFTVNQPGTFTVTTTGSPAPALSITSGTLPAGVTFTDNGDGTATIAGTANTTGVFPITITASNGITPNATQNFTLRIGATTPVQVSLPNVTAEAGTTILVPVTVGDVTGLGIDSFELTVRFDPSVLQPASTPFSTAGTLVEAQGGTPFFEILANGDLRVGAFGTGTPLSGSGTLIFLRFNVLPGPGAVTSPLTFINFQFGEGTPAETTTNGSVTRFGPTAAPANIGGRIMTASGKGISKARVMISGGDLEEPLYVLTNGFGYYNFENLSVGETYIIEVKAKGYKFANSTLVINLQDNLTGTDFIGEVDIYGAK